MPVADAAAGKIIAERDCKTCHGVDGKGVAPAIPNLAAQRAQYLFNSLMEYKNGQRTHAALENLATSMSEADMRNVAAYFASLPPIANQAATDVKHSSPYEQGRAARRGLRQMSWRGRQQRPSPARPVWPASSRIIWLPRSRNTTRATACKRRHALEFARIGQARIGKPGAVFRRPDAGQSAPSRRPSGGRTGDCHVAGRRAAAANVSVSVMLPTPGLAGQDAEYLVKATKAYKTTRKNWGMQRYVAGLSDKDIENISACYATQTPRAADQVPTVHPGTGGEMRSLPS